MAGIIKVDPSVIAGQVSNFESKRAEFESMIGQIQSAVQALDGAWMGSAYQSYDATMQVWNQDVGRVLADLATLNSLVRQGVANFEETDSAAASSFQIGL